MNQYDIGAKREWLRLPRHMLFIHKLEGGVSFMDEYHREFGPYMTYFQAQQELIAYEKLVKGEIEEWDAAKGIYYDANS